MILAGAGLLAAAGAMVLMRTGDREPFERIEMRRLTASGVAGDVTISPDGKFVAHSEFRDGRQRYMIRQVATGSGFEVGPPFKGYTLGTTITPDGEFLLYGLQDQGEHRLGAVFRVPLLGGHPRKVIDDVQSSVAVSPDGSRLAFLRAFPGRGEEALIVCSSEGTDQRTLAVRHGADAFSIAADQGPDWSPDGRLIAVGAGRVVDRPVLGILLVTVADGTQDWLGPADWESVHRVAWYPDGSGLAVIGRRGGSGSTQLWWLGYPEGQVRRITNDVSSYLTASIGITRDGTTIAAGQYDFRSSLWRAELERSDNRPIGREGPDRRGMQGLAAVPDGGVVFSSRASGTADLWIAGPDGRDPVPITADPDPDYDPAVTRDGSRIVFGSNRAGLGLWIIGIDGRGLRRLTDGEDYLPAVSPDGQWVYFDRWSGSRVTVWRVPLEGGEPHEVIALPSSGAALSPDASLLACSYQEGEGKPWRVAVLPAQGGDPMMLFDFGEIWFSSAELRWSADGRGLIYIDQEDGIYNLYLKPVGGGPARRLTEFESGVIFRFDLFPDRRTAVCARGSRTSDVVLIRDAS